MTTQTSAYYSFFPHLRQGLANLIAEEDSLTGGTGARAQISFDVNIERTKTDDTTDLGTASRSVDIIGPGDVTGLNSKAVIRHAPEEGDQTFEPNYLPFVEFYDEDFPWRYSPAKAKTESLTIYQNRPVNDQVQVDCKRLRPWLSLVVLKTDEFSYEQDFNGVLPAINVNNAKDSFQPNDTSWAWAHVQINKDLGDPSTGTAVADALGSFETLMGDESNADRALSRIICPRKLTENTKYHAFLIPTYEIGRLTGLGQEIGTVKSMAPAWTDSDTSTKQFPYYYHWQFETTDSSDFESLVDALVPRVIEDNAVKREMDIQKPGNPILDGTSDQPTVNVYGALKSPSGSDAAWNPYDDSNRFNKKLRSILNLSDDYQQTSPGADPIITPPIYGQWAALRKRVFATEDFNPPEEPSSPNWIDELNLDPSLRVLAGIGANVVREKQEEFMSQAWKQVGDIIEANKKLKSGQNAEEASRLMYNKSVNSENDEGLLLMTHNLHSRLKSGSTSLSSAVGNSRIPNQCFSGTFRKLTSKNGKLSKALDKNRTAFLDNTSGDEDIIDAFNTTLTTAPDYVSPTGQADYDVFNAGQLTVAHVNGIPLRNTFYLTKPGTTAMAPGNMAPETIHGTEFRGALLVQHGKFDGQVHGPAAWNASLAIDTTASGLRGKIKPDESVKNAVTKKISGTSLSEIKQVMATPKIKAPMYKALLELDSEAFMPNMKESLPDNTIALLESNQKFIEAYLAGMNHEMARELLWREYPTDQRGSVFQEFWSNQMDPWDTQATDQGIRNIKPIHEWTDGASLASLGDNNPGSINPDNLVLAIRSDLLRKYPNLSVFAIKATWDANGKRLFDDNIVNGANTKYPIFSATASPDITFLGFDLTDTEAIGGSDPQGSAGWFFVFKERAGDIRFGLDLPVNGFPSIGDTSLTESWDDMSWAHMGNSGQSLADVKFLNLNKHSLDFGSGPSADDENVYWGTNAADVAYILEQKPVIIGIHATDMLPE